jgi:hypothetical protein
MLNSSVSMRLIKTCAFTVGLHWITVAIVLLTRGNLDRPIHFYYEPLLLKVLLLLDLPALSIAKAFGVSLDVMLLNNSPLSTVIVFLMITLQWFLVSIILVAVISSIRQCLQKLE